MLIYVAKSVLAGFHVVGIGAISSIAGRTVKVFVVGLTESRSTTSCHLYSEYFLSMADNMKSGSFSFAGSRCDHARTRRSFCIPGGFTLEPCRPLPTLVARLVTHSPSPDKLRAPPTTARTASDKQSRPRKSLHNQLARPHRSPVKSPTPRTKVFPLVRQASGTSDKP